MKKNFNPLNPELNPICYLLALLAHHVLRVSRIRVKHLVMDFKAICTRICTLRIKGKFFNYTIINVHAPTEVSTEEEKDSFYDLQKSYEQSPTYDVKIVVGGMNAQVGKEEMYCPTIGKST